MVEIDIFVVVIVVVVAALAFLIGALITNRRWEGKVAEIREEAIKRSRAVIGGQFSEQLAPFLPDFPYKPTEARFIGKPIDLLVFKGMDEKEITEVIFVEIKSGKSSVNKHERMLRDVIKQGKVSWVEYRIPEKITEKTGKSL